MVALAQRNRVYFGRHEEGILESPFAGNLVDICPTGVFTDKTFKKHFTRKWDLETAPSVCTQCSYGCHVLPAARYNELRRVTPHYNEAVNGYFICDRGRFGYSYHSGPTRLREPMRRTDTERQSLTRQQAWQELKQIALTDTGIAGIGSPRASLETNYALRKLVGTKNFSTGLAHLEQTTVQAGLKIYQQKGLQVPELTDIEAADVIVVFGCDVTAELPRADLAVRQAVRNGAKLFIASVRLTALDEIATARASCDPASLLELVTACRQKQTSKETKDSLAPQIAAALQQAKRPLFITGPLQAGSALGASVAELIDSLQTTEGVPSFLFAFAEANSVGVGLLGGETIEAILERIEAGEIQKLIVAENDLFVRALDRRRLLQALEKLETLIVLDHTESETIAHSDLAIPVATQVEATGLWVSATGRAARAYAVYRPEPWIPAAWQVLGELGSTKTESETEAETTPDDLLFQLAQGVTLFQPVLNLAHAKEWKEAGQKIPRLSARASGRTALPVWKDIRQHPRPPQDTETPFSFSMEGYSRGISSDLIPRFWAPNWNSQEAINKYQTGSSGVCLIGTLKTNAAGPVDAKSFREGTARAPVAERIPCATRRGSDQLLLVPVAEIFGSERFSRLSPTIAELTPNPYLELHPQTAKRFKLTAGQLCKVSWDHADATLTVCMNESLAPDVGAVPAGFAETGYLQHPTGAKLTPLTGAKN